MEKTILELFSGSKTVSKVFENHSWRSVTVDNNPGLNPSICCDILNLKKETVPGNVAFIWASPDCTYFSRAAAQSNWQKETIRYRIYNHVPVTDAARNAVNLINKVIEIINWFPGVPFVIENPIGRIHHTAAVKSLGHYRYFVNYYDFGFEYSKETYIFSNFFLPFATKKHKVNAPGLRTVRNVYERSKVPPLLVEKIFDYVPF